MTRLRFGWLAFAPLILAMALPAGAQTDQLLPEIDAYYKISSPLRIWFQAKETREAGAPTTAEIGPSLDFYLKPLVQLSDITTFDLDDSKSRFFVISVGYRYLPTPNTSPHKPSGTVLHAELSNPKDQVSAIGPQSRGPGLEIGRLHMALSQSRAVGTHGKVSFLPLLALRQRRILL